MSWIRSRWVVLGATALGAVLVVAAFQGGVGWESVSLELGAGLALVAIIYGIERQLERTVKLQSAQHDAQIAEVAAQVADVRIEFHEKFNSMAMVDAVAELTEADDDLLTSYLKDPTPTGLFALAARVTDLGLPIPELVTRFATAADPDEVPGLKDVRLGSIRIGAAAVPTVRVTQAYSGGNLRVKQPTAQVWEWTDGMSADALAVTMLDRWPAMQHLWPGADAANELVIQALRNAGETIATAIREQMDGHPGPST